MASEWTVDTLKEHYDALRVADSRALEAALATANRALEALAETQKEQRAAQNEWRGTVRDIMGSRKGMKDLWGYIIGAIGVALALAGFFLRKS